MPMKVLIVSNLYPPHYVGGYELRCSRVAEWLCQAGHQVRVLTSTYRLPGAASVGDGNAPEMVNGVPVERSLRYYRYDRSPKHFYSFQMAARQLDDASRFLQILEEFRPDVVNWWNLEGITKAILLIPRARGVPDACSLDDIWLIREYGLSGEKDGLGWFRFWQGDWGPLYLRPLVRAFLAQRQNRVERSGIPTRPLSQFACHACYVSEFIRFEHAHAGLTFPSEEVIYGGVDPEQFYAAPRTPLQQGNGLRLLYAGYVEENRGLHTIIEALGLLPRELLTLVRLSIVPSGPPQPTRYVENVKERIRYLGLLEQVKFLAKHSHDEMPRVYRDHDLLILASKRPEGLPLTMMEALCAGCAVITTGSGGAIEIADVAGLPVFPQRHPVALSRLLAKLIANPALVSEIASRGQQAVLERFTFARMMREYSRMLTSLCEGRAVEPKHLEPASVGLAAHSIMRESGR